jgi:hypothetical protein
MRQKVSGPVVSSSTLESVNIERGPSGYRLFATRDVDEQVRPTRWG